MGTFPKNRFLKKSDIRIESVPNQFYGYFAKKYISQKKKSTHRISEKSISIGISPQKGVKNYAKRTITTKSHHRKP